MSQQRVSYVNGTLVPESQASISILDLGLLFGQAVYDVERTYRGQIFRLENHMDRLYDSLSYTRIDPGLSREEMTQAILQVLEANRPLLGPTDEYSITQIVSRGNRDPEGRIGSANVVIYCRPIPFWTFAKYYVQGARVVTPATRRIPPQCLSPKAKTSNKMNHHIAEFEAKSIDPEAYSLMLDLDGNVSECTSNNFLFMRDGTIKIPNRRNVLEGITMGAMLDIAHSLGIPTEEGDYTLFDVYRADEAVITSASLNILPVASVNGRKIGRGVPGPITASLWQAWSDIVGVDIVEQALSHIPPGERRSPNP